MRTLCASDSFAIFGPSRDTEAKSIPEVGVNMKPQPRFQLFQAAQLIEFVVSDDGFRDFVELDSVRIFGNLYSFSRVTFSIF